MIFSRIKVFVWLLCISLALICFASHVECAKKSATPAPATPVVHEPVIEEVTQKQLERLLQDKDYVAVYWCKCLTTQPHANGFKWERRMKKRKMI